MKPISARRASFVEPMQALPAEKLPEGDWLYEVKLDGYRALAFKDGGHPTTSFVNRSSWG
jgi:bifunctional non-homologous end joining protein LigD